MHVEFTATETEGKGECHQDSLLSGDVFAHLGSITVDDAHTPDIVHREVQVFGEFPDLSILILPRQRERPNYWPPSFLWLTSPSIRVWSLETCFHGDLCAYIS